jgi:hypothetical protein
MVSSSPNDIALQFCAVRPSPSITDKSIPACCNNQSPRSMWSMQYAQCTQLSPSVSCRGNTEHNVSCFPRMQPMDFSVYGAIEVNDSNANKQTSKQDTYKQTSKQDTYKQTNQQTNQQTRHIKSCISLELNRIMNRSYLCMNVGAVFDKRFYNVLVAFRARLE